MDRRPIKGFERYEITRDGRVFSKIRGGRELRLWSMNGYPAVSLMATGASRPTKIAVHRLVADAYLQNANECPCINHKDGNKSNNNVSNLEWCSFLENNEHARLNGLSTAFCENHYKAKLSNEDVQKIREFLVRGHRHRWIANRFGVARQTITKINGGRSWRRL